jgi:hypothetical protein
VIYDHPSPDESIDQGDLIDGCLMLYHKHAVSDADRPPEIDYSYRTVVVVTQTCDLANQKVTYATVAEVFDAQFLIDQKLFKPAEVKGPLRAGRVWGWYFLPADAGLGLGEMVVDLRRLHTVRLDLLRGLCAAGKRRGRLRVPYREHLAKHFADTFSRIGLPRPYETL